MQEDKSEKMEEKTDMAEKSASEEVMPEEKTMDDSKPMAEGAKPEQGNKMMIILVAALLVIIIILLILLFLNQQSGENNSNNEGTPTPTETTTPTEEPTSTVTPTTTPTGPVDEADAGHSKDGNVKIYMVDASGTATGETAFGCGDEVVGVDRTVSSTNTPVTTALEKLFAVSSETFGATGLRNALYNSSVVVSSVQIDDTKAIVNLTGSISSAGECDDPRIEEQIIQTVLQFSWIDEAEVNFNGGLLHDYFDLSG